MRPCTPVSSSLGLGNLSIPVPAAWDFSEVRTLTASTSIARSIRQLANLNAYAERWVQSLKHECLNHFIVLGERHLRHIVHEYVEHYHRQRPHQAKGNTPLADTGPPPDPRGHIVCHRRLGGLLKHYTRRAA